MLDYAFCIETFNTGTYETACLYQKGVHVLEPLADNAAKIFELTASRHFVSWLVDSRLSLSFSTYQAGKLFFLGVKLDGRLSVFERSFPRCMGLGLSQDGRSLLVTTEHQIFRMDNVHSSGLANNEGIDATFAPHQSWITGDLDIHDIGFDSVGQPIFVNTLFNCLATVSAGYSFKPVWRPSFISRLAAEDRCHLNGMALVDGAPVYVTAVSRSDSADGWRDRRTNGGIVIAVESGEIAATGLSMPHSPRVHDGQLWLLNSGTGEFGRVDANTGRFEPLAFVPGFARGLCFHGSYAIIGLSLARESSTFKGLPLDEALVSCDAEPRCGLAVIDLNSGDMVHWVRIAGIVREMYDVVVLPGTRYPAAIGFKGNEIRQVISVDD